MEEKAQETLQKTREGETGAKHNHQMMMQTLKVSIKVATGCEQGIQKKCIR